MGDIVCDAARALLSACQLAVSDGPMRVRFSLSAALTHDYRLVGFAPLEASQQMWAWSTSHACSLPEDQQLVFMLARLEALDSARSAAAPQVSIRGGAGSGSHPVLVFSHLESADTNGTDGRHSQEERRDQVMRAMGRQRLINQVSTLETSAAQQQNRGSKFDLALYAVPDLECFLSNLRCA